MHIMLTKEMQILEEHPLKDKITRIFLSHKAPLRNSDSEEPIGILGVSIDITHQKN